VEPASEDRKLCSCGGTMVSRGFHRLTMDIPLFRFAGGADESEYGEDVELFVCEACRKMEFYFVPDIDKARGQLPPLERYKQLYADFSEKKLKKIVQSESYQDEAKRAAQILLNEKFK